MQRTKVILAVVCIFAASFSGGAATYAQLSDTETATVSAAAGAFNLCAAGETITYEFSRSSDTLVHVSGPNIVTFSNYDYSTVLGDPRAVDAVDFVSTEPFRSVQFRSRFGGTGSRTFNPPISQGRLEAGGSFFDAFVRVTLTCAGGSSAQSVSNVQSASTPKPASLSGSSNSSDAIAESPRITETTSETPVRSTESESATPENTASTPITTSSSTETQTPTATTTATTTEAPTTTSTKTPTQTQTATTETATTKTSEPATRPTELPEAARTSTVTSSTTATIENTTAISPTSSEVT